MQVSPRFHDSSSEPWAVLANVGLLSEVAETLTNVLCFSAPSVHQTWYTPHPAFSVIAFTLEMQCSAYPRNTTKPGRIGMGWAWSTVTSNYSCIPYPTSKHIFNETGWATLQSRCWRKQCMYHCIRSLIHRGAMLVPL